MSDPVNLLVPTDGRFRAIGPELAGRFCVAHGGSETDAAVVTEAVTKVVDDLGIRAEDGAEMTLDFRAPEGNVEVTVRCSGRSSVVTRAISPTRATT